MIDLELADKFLIYDLVARTLERDQQHLDKLKTGRVLAPMYESAVKVAKEELVLIKEEMKRVDLKLDKEIRESDLITEFHFIQRGYLQKQRYVNNACGIEQ